MSDLRAGKQRRGGVGTGGDTGAASDAGSRVHRAVGVLLGDQDRIAVGRAPGRHGYVSASGDDPIECTPVHREISHDRKGACAPWLEVQFITIPKMPHVKLANRRGRQRPVSNAVDYESARPANPFATIVVERDRVFAFLAETLVQV